MDLNGFALNAMSGGIFSCVEKVGQKHVWVSINASGLGMLSLAQEFFSEQRSGVKVKI